MSSGPVTLDFSNPEKIVPPTPAPQPDPASTLRQSVSYGASQNPDQYAKLISLHKQTGVPPEVAQGNESEVQHAADVNKLDYSTLAVDHPRTTAWASNPDNAAVSGVDEVQRMAGVEKNAGVMRSLSAFDWYKGKVLRPLMEYPITRWALEATGGAAGMAGNVASFLGLHGSGDTPKNFLQRIESNLEPEDVGLQSNPLDWLAKNVAPMAPAIAASGGTSFIAKALGLSTKAAKVLNGLAIGSLFTADQGGKTYTQMKESGASDYEARLAANKVAAINAPANALFGATELVPFLRNNPVGTSLFLGGTTGASGQVSQNVVTGQPWYKGVIGASLQGAAVQGGMHIGSEMFFDHLGQVIDAADQSKLKQRSPEAFHDAMSTVFEGDPSLKIPVDQFMEYFHSKGVSAQQVAEQLGAKNYAEALVSGGDVEVPMADFLSKLDSEHQQALFPNVAGPDGLTLRQHEEGRTELESWMASGGPEKLRAESAQADAETAATPEYIATKEELRNRYIGAGETPDVAETLATKDANVYANLAKQVGMKPDELMKLYDPQVKAAEAPGVEGQLNQPAYHGSPYKFDKFSLEHLGKGEGAQAYGHGLYFAGNKEVADFYRDALAGYQIDGEAARVTMTEGPRELAAAALSRFGDKQEAIDWIGDHFPSNGKEAKKIIRSAKTFGPDKGQLYEADIPGDETMLHWDKKLSEQPEKVQDAIREFSQSTDNPVPVWDILKDKKGEDFYRILSSEAAGGDEGASKLLNSLGINGIKYRDGSSRDGSKVEWKDGVDPSQYHRLTQKVAENYLRASDGDVGKAIAELDKVADKHEQYADAAQALKSGDLVPKLNHNYVVFDDKAIKVLKTFYQSNDEGQPRGWFRVLPDGSFEIGRTSIGDLSTFIHEPAHGYLKVIGDLAKREDASETLKGDYSKILDYLGAKDGETLSTDQQEKWARANEQYLREGKAPSEGLKGVFQRFAVWLSSIYKKASDLGVELTDDIRGVFDRLYAAEEGVNRAESESGPRLFSSPEEAGWTEEQFKKYAESKGLELDQAKSEILSKLNEAALREKTDTWREEEKNVREAMTAEIDRKPEYLAIRALRKGKLPDGTELTLNREELVKQFGEDRVKALQKMHPGLYRNEGGVDTESAAEMLGFDSAGKMLSVLEATPRRSAAIEEATKQYMTAKHGDIRYDGTLNDQARLAVENEKRAQNLHSELTALRRKVAELKAKDADKKAALRGIEVAPIDAYREAAKQMVESKAIADLMPNRYLDASRKYSREAFDALRKGDVEEAAQAKHKELMNHFLFREATKAREFVSQVERFADKVASPKRQSDIGKAGQDFLSQIQAILGKYRFVDMFKNPSVAQAESLGDFLTRMRDEGQDMPIAPGVIDGVGKPYRTLSVGELRDVNAALKMLDHVARNINKITIEGRKVEEAKVANELDQSLIDNVKGGERNSGDRVSDDARKFMDRVKDSLGKIDISVLRPEFLFKRLDGVKDFGPWHAAFFDKYNDAQDHLTNLRESIFPKVLEIARGDWSKTLDERIYIKSIDATVSKNDIFAILLNSGNDSNMEKLERGGLRFKVDGAAVPLTEDVRQELFKHLNADDIDKANQILKMIGTLKPEAEALALKRNGVAPQWIESRPYQTQNGALEGGYFPLVYDPRWSAAGEKQADANTVDQMFNRYATATTRQGYTKERTGFAAPLSLDWQTVVMRHLDNVMVDISHWQFVTEAQRLLKNPVVKESLISNMGEAYHKNLMDWVRFTVNQDTMGREATDGIDKLRRTVRSNVGTAVLGFRVMNAVVETGITPLLALQQAHPVSVYKGMMTFMRNPVEAMRFAQDTSDYMKNIDVQYDRQITEMWNDLRGDHSIMGDIKKWAIMSRVGIWKIGSAMAWHAGFQDAQRMGLDGDAAVRVADALNRKIQEAGRPGDLSAVERNPYMRELTMFAGPTIIQFNNYMEATHAIGDKGLNAQTAAKAMTVLLAGHLVNSVLFELWRGKGPDDKDKWPAWLMGRMTLGLFDGVPGLNIATRYAESKINGERGGEPRLQPMPQLAKDSVDAIATTLEAAKGDATWAKAMKQDARTIGGWTGLPMTQGIITGQYIYDRMTGEYRPQHPWSHITDAFYARRKH